MAHLLIVDDEKSIRRTLGELLRAEGHAVVEAGDAEEALARMADGDFDVVVTDIIMPRLSGVELLRRLQAINPRVQVVMMTGEPTVETATESLRTGAADYLFKPVNKAALLRAVGNALRIKSLDDTRRRLEAENRAHQENLERLVDERTAQLSASEERFKILFQYAPDAYYLHDLHGTFVDGNRAAEELVGYRRDELVGKNLFELDLLSPEGLAQATVLLGRSVRGEATGPDEFILQRKDGRRLMAEMRTYPMQIGPQVLVLGLARDITERKRAEEQLRQLARAVEQSPVSIVITDRAGRIEFVNPKFTQVTGYAAEEVLGQNPRILKTGQTPPETYRELWETITAGQEWRGEFHNRRKDGTLFWETASISPVRDPAGTITHFIAVKEDVTEQRLTEAKLLRAQRVESIGSLASGIAHDLNNILTPILMCAPLLHQEESTHGRRKLAETIEASAERAAGIVKQLLGFARGKEGQRQLIQVRHLMKDMAKMARETFPRNIRVEVKCAPHLWPVVADATQLHQVLLNLCVNARDAMPAGGKLLLRAENVTLDEHFVSMYPDAAPGPHVRLQVQDTGTGMSDAVQERIFETFFTTKGEAHGTGLGLVTVQGIVRDHQGFITFTSTPGKGTTFEIHLPAAPEAPPAADQLPVQPVIPGVFGERVLVVDDEPAICDTTRRTLERQGYAVVLAHDGIDALAQFASQPGRVQAVVTDYMMPFMDGVTLCRALRRLSPATPLIVSSGGLFGKGGSEALQAFAELGITHVLHKPHTGDVLLRALHEAMHPAPPAPAPQKETS